jgi:hypothetical protein
VASEAAVFSQHITFQDAAAAANVALDWYARHEIRSVLLLLATNTIVAWFNQLSTRSTAAAAAAAAGSTTPIL